MDEALPVRSLGKGRSHPFVTHKGENLEDKYSDLALLPPIFCLGLHWLNSVGLPRGRGTSPHGSASRGTKWRLEKGAKYMWRGKNRKSYNVHAIYFVP